MKKNIKYFFACILIFSFYILTAQETKKPETNRAIDSLLNVLKRLYSPPTEVKLVAGTDTTKTNTLILLSKQYASIENQEFALKYVEEALLLAENINYKKGMASGYNLLGSFLVAHGDYEKGLANFQKSLKYRMEIGDKKGVSYSYNNISIVYIHLGNYAKSLDNSFKALKISDEIGDKFGMALSINNIGNIKFLQGDLENSLAYYLKNLKIFKELDNKIGIAASHNNIAGIYCKQQSYEKALDNYSKSLKISAEIGDKKGETNSSIGLGNIYKDQRNYKKALDNYLKALKIQTETNDIHGIITSNVSIGNVYSEQNEFEKSEQYIKRSLLLAQKIEEKDLIKEAYSSLSYLYDKKGDYKQAYNYHKMYSDIKDTLLNEQSSKQIAEMNTKYESEKKEKDILLLTKDKNLQQAEIGKQKLIRNGSIGGLLLALSLAFILFNRFRVTNKQKKIIESQNFQIVESINYSKKIQDSLLPSMDNMRKAIPDLFLFYEPKAIVSGDFYYFKEFEKYTILACVDCTGHGVPGGFMSTLGSLLLDKIVDDEALSPSEILNKLSDEIVRVLHQQDGGEIQDGMDLSICLIDRNNHKIEFSGARNGIIVVTNGQAKRYKADPLPVGGNYMKKGIAIERNFKTQHIPINTNDWIYMYTDGFMEQVGGEAGIPMNYMQFENQLINVSKIESPKEKNKLLQTELDNWRGTHERDDDVLILGFQLG